MPRGGGDSQETHHRIKTNLDLATESNLQTYFFLTNSVAFSRAKEEKGKSRVASPKTELLMI